MIGPGEALLGFSMMLGLMLIGLPVAVAMFLTAFIGALSTMGWPILMTFGNQIWRGRTISS